jgi:hypothetical protein
MSFKSRTSKTWVLMANHMEEEMVKVNVATPEVHQRGGLSALFQLSNSSNKTIW